MVPFTNSFIASEMLVIGIEAQNQFNPTLGQHREHGRDDHHDAER